MNRIAICAALALSACSGSPGGTADSGAVPKCLTGERWNGTACAPSKWATVTVGEERGFGADGGLGPIVSGASVAFYAYLDGGPLGVDPFPQAGCDVESGSWHLPDAGTSTPVLYEHPFTGDWGEVVALGTAQGQLKFDLDSGYGEFTAPMDSSEPLLTTGTEITFAASGSGDFPAATVFLLVPPELRFTPTPLIRGQPYVLRWTGTFDQGLTFQVAASGQTEWFVAHCVVPDTGSFELGPEVTSKLPPDVTSADVWLVRGAVQTLYPPDAFVVETFAVARELHGSVEVR